MFGSSILEIAIGLVFVFLLLSLICTAINEIIEAKLKNRATDLERGIRELFDEERAGDLVKKFYNHPLIYGLYSGKYKNNDKKLGFWDYWKKTNLPSYIPAGNFAYAVMDIVLNKQIIASPPNGAPGTSLIKVEDILSSVDAVSNNERFQLALGVLAQQSGGDINKLRENIEGWFNSSMDRVSGWYTRRTKWIILMMGLILTIFLNVNTITIAKRLANDNALRNSVVAEAEKIANKPDAPGADFEKNREQLESLGLPIGRDGFQWYSGVRDDFDLWNNLFLHLFGWLLTAAAISLGAPFWFDVLNKFMVIRSTVKPHEKSPEESSEDRQRRSNTDSTLTIKTESQTPGVISPN